mgnify:CR=1 FL=1|tara:strand:- start:359 stop:1096 length:738 start_codon:yes stop_codon:yes gene_type:complete
MKIKKIDDYQSWYIESDNTAIIIDPWLDKVMQPKSNFFINRSRDQNALIDDEMINKVSCILISAPFEDHLHEKSLKKFDPKTLVLTSKPSEKKLKKLGFCNIEILKAGNQKCLGDLKIKTHDAGYPYNYLWTFSFEIIHEDKILYFESHVDTPYRIRQKGLKADCAILTSEEVKILGLLRLSNSSETTLEILKELECKNIMIQGSDPAETKGFISYFLKIGKENLEIFERNNINVFKDPGSEVII